MKLVYHHEVKKFTAKMVQFIQRLKPGEAIRDAGFPYPYLSKADYAKLGNPLYIKVTVETWNPDEEVDDGDN